MAADEDGVDPTVVPSVQNGPEWVGGFEPGQVRAGDDEVRVEGVDVGGGVGHGEGKGVS